MGIWKDIKGVSNNAAASLATTLEAVNTAASGVERLAKAGEIHANNVVIDAEISATKANQRKLKAEAKAKAWALKYLDDQGNYRNPD